MTGAHLTWAPGGTEAADMPLQVLAPLPRTNCSIWPLIACVKGRWYPFVYMWDSRAALGHCWQKTS